MSRLELTPEAIQAINDGNITFEMLQTKRKELDVWANDWQAKGKGRLQLETGEPGIWVIRLRETKEAYAGLAILESAVLERAKKQ